MHKHKHNHIGRAYIYFSIALRMDVNNSSSHRDWRAKVSIKRRLYLRFHDCYHTRIYADDIQCSCKLISSILFNMFASMLLAHTVCYWYTWFRVCFALLCFALVICVCHSNGFDSCKCGCYCSMFFENYVDFSAHQYRYCCDSFLPFNLQFVSSIPFFFSSLSKVSFILFIAVNFNKIFWNWIQIQNNETLKKEKYVNQW